MLLSQQQIPDLGLATATRTSRAVVNKSKHDVEDVSKRMLDVKGLIKLRYFVQIVTKLIV